MNKKVLKIAFVAAIALSGMNVGRFTFEGFLSMNKQSRREHLASVRDEKRTMIFYEAPHKLAATLKDLYETLGDREITIVREITKIHEECVEFNLSDGLAKEKRGEYVLLVEGAKEKENPLNAMTETEHIKFYMDLGLDKKDALKKTAKDRGVSKSDLYKFALDL